MMAVNVHSETWEAVERHVTERIQTLREENDNERLSHDDTQFVRGGIAELKALLNLPNETAPTEVVGSANYID